MSCKPRSRLPKAPCSLRSAIQAAPAATTVFRHVDSTCRRGLPVHVSADLMPKLRFIQNLRSDAAPGWTMHAVLLEVRCAAAAASAPFQIIQLANLAWLLHFKKYFVE